MELDWGKVLVLDLEGTDGTYGQPTEVLQLSLLAGDGTTRLNEYFKPARARKWPYSQKVHHITKQMVADKPHFAAWRDDVQAQINAAQCVVGFGMGQDLHVLMQYGIKVPPAVQCFDVYDGFMSYCNALQLDGQEHSLAACAAYFGYAPQGEWHDSLEDCRATLFCFQQLLAAAAGCGQDWEHELRLRSMPRDPRDKNSPPRKRRHRAGRRVQERRKAHAASREEGNDMPSGAVAAPAGALPATS